MTAIVSEKGQITIPKALRERLGIRPGQPLEVREEQGRLVLTKAVTGSGIDSLVGILKPGKSTDALIERLRGPVDACD